MFVIPGGGAVSRLFRLRVNESEWTAYSAEGLVIVIVPS